MKPLTLTIAMMAAGFLMAAPAFAQTAPVQKQKTQEGGATGTPCNLVANPMADPDCKNYKQRTQNLTPAYGQVPDPAGKPK